MEIDKLYYAQANIWPSNAGYPFCILEAGMSGSIDNAVSQCARKGTALFSGARLLYYVANLLDLSTSGTELSTAIFSLAVILNITFSLVHRAEGDSQGITRFHTSRICTKGWRIPDLAHSHAMILITFSSGEGESSG